MRFFFIHLLTVLMVLTFSVTIAYSQTNIKYKTTSKELKRKLSLSDSVTAYIEKAIQQKNYQLDTLNKSNKLTFVQKINAAGLIQYNYDNKIEGILTSGQLVQYHQIQNLKRDSLIQARKNNILIKEKYKK